MGSIYRIGELSVIFYTLNLSYIDSLPFSNIDFATVRPLKTIIGSKRPENVSN